MLTAEGREADLPTPTGGDADRDRLRAREDRLDDRFPRSTFGGGGGGTIEYSSLDLADATTDWISMCPRVRAR